MEAEAQAANIIGTVCEQRRRKVADRCRDDKAGEEVHGEVEAVGCDCCHEQIRCEGYTHDAIIGEVQQGLCHEQQEPEELACRHKQM